jgi:hypothetical protein
VLLCGEEALEGTGEEGSQHLLWVLGIYIYMSGENLWWMGKWVILLINMILDIEGWMAQTFYLSFTV